MIGIARRFNNGIVRQIGNNPVIDGIKVAPVHSACLQPFNYIGAVFLAPVLSRVFQRRVLHPIGKIGLEPVAPLRADPQVAPGFSINPAAQINPVHDFTAALAVPRHIFTQVAVGLGAVIAEAAQHINPHLFGPAEFRVLFKSFKQSSGQIPALMLRGNIPGLVIDPGANDIHLGFLQPVDLGNLVMSMLHSVAKPDRPHTAVFVAGPGQHSHWVRIIEQQHIRCSRLSNVTANLQHLGNPALPVHNAACA
ncbi:hypothetical protein D3C73_611870 [compost metagenome]